MKQLSNAYSSRVASSATIVAIRCVALRLLFYLCVLVLFVCLFVGVDR